MNKKIIPLMLPVVAIVGGAFAGNMLRAPSDGAAEVAPAHAAGDHAEPSDDGHAADGHETESHAEPADDGHGDVEHAAPGEAAWFTFPTQFFVPLMRQGDLQDMMILTLTLQTDGASLGALGRKEHVLRDSLLRQLMIHANTGGFDGNFTADRNLAVLREDLLKAAQAVTDLPIEAVLIEDIARQPG
ncbi:hypothetical protein [Paracoccus rhizosphaerae]|uniref:Flagellar basal body-associated protein FliL n=1 Tax=Paracoccus rhizosphaerae TaxID=1133347 RepID=A0ABV6CL07_9RHOB|nr:hypothetical protein [Paracoccus rhizosphaerae]